MRYWIDTEFIEDGKTIDLISIGIVAEDGREYYALNVDCDWSKANQWVKDNVLASLPDKPEDFEYSSTHQKQSFLRHSLIGLQILEFMRWDITSHNMAEESTDLESTKVIYIPPKEKPEIWAYYADYDWVVFCQLFGTMMDLPKGMPMYCRDVKQLCDRLGNPPLPKQKEDEHNALADARWNKQAYYFLKELEAQQS